MDLFASIELSTHSVEQIRSLMNLGIEKQIKEEVKEIHDFTIELSDRHLQCRLYEPFSTTDALIVYFLGDGFMFGNIELFDHVCRKECITCSYVKHPYHLPVYTQKA